MHSENILHIQHLNEILAGSTIISNCSNLRIWVKNAKIILAFVAKLLILKSCRFETSWKVIYAPMFAFLKLKVFIQMFFSNLILFLLFYGNYTSPSLIEQISNNSSFYLKNNWQNNEKIPKYQSIFILLKEISELLKFCC